MVVVCVTVCASGDASRDVLRGHSEAVHGKRSQRSARLPSVPPSHGPVFFPAPLLRTKRGSLPPLRCPPPRVDAAVDTRTVHPDPPPPPPSGFSPQSPLRRAPATGGRVISPQLDRLTGRPQVGHPHSRSRRLSPPVRRGLRSHAGASGDRPAHASRVTWRKKRSYAPAVGWVSGDVTRGLPHCPQARGVERLLTRRLSRLSLLPSAAPDCQLSPSQLLCSQPPLRHRSFARQHRLPPPSDLPITIAGSEPAMTAVSRAASLRSQSPSLRPLLLLLLP